MEHQDHHQPDPIAPPHAEGVQVNSRGSPRSGTPGEPPISDCSFPRGAQRPEGELDSTPTPRDVLAALRGIDIFNSIIAGHKVEASKALLEMALDKDHDPAERRKCATAIMRAPFQRYPSAAAINGPTPPKSKRRKNDDDDPDNDDGDNGGNDDQPPTPPADLMRAYDHGYWNGYATKHWPKPTVETVEEATANFASHAPGRQEPFQSDNLPELPYTHRHPQGALGAALPLHPVRGARWLPGVNEPPQAARLTPGRPLSILPSHRGLNAPDANQNTLARRPHPPSRRSVVRERLLLEECCSPRGR